MKPLTETLLRRLAVAGLVFACHAGAWAQDCAYAEQDAKGTGIGGTGTMAKGTGIGGTGIQLGVFRNEMRLVGSVTAIEGEIQVKSDGNTRHLSKGDPVCVGDTITTPASASVRLKTADGGLVEIRPQTQLRIEKFVYRGTDKDSSLLVLDKGACRVVTGNIGKLHPRNDLLRTPDATIGIREADHETAVILPDGDQGYPAGTYDKVNHGTTFISTDAGEVSVHPEQAGFVAGAGKEPALLQEIPAFYRSGDTPE